MKILHVMSSLNPVYGGPAEAVKQLIRSEKRLGYDVELAVNDKPGAPWLVDMGFKVHVLGPRYFKHAFAPNFAPWLCKHARLYDAVIMHGLWMYHGYITAWILKKQNIPYFMFTHGQLGTWFKRNYPLKHIKKWLYWQLLEHKNMHNAKAIFFTSEEDRRQSRESFRPYIVNEAVIGYGTVTPPGNHEQQREMFFTQYPFLRKKRLFLFLSRLNKQKACDMLIEAFSAVAKDDASLHLIMAGPDQDGWKKDLVRQSVQLNIEKQITWTGMLTGDLKWGAYHAAECFVLPSRHESFGVAVAEALACGTPTLISNKVNIWREIEAAGAGLVANDDLDGTVLMFRQWINFSNTEKHRMCNNAIQCFSDNFEVGRAAQKMISVIKKYV